jgi:hypothetical protein
VVLLFSNGCGKAEPPRPFAADTMHFATLNPYYDLPAY